MIGWHHLSSQLGPFTQLPVISIKKDSTIQKGRPNQSNQSHLTSNLVPQFGKASLQLSSSGQQQFWAAEIERLQNTTLPNAPNVLISSLFWLFCLFFSNWPRLCFCKDTTDNTDSKACSVCKNGANNGCIWKSKYELIDPKNRFN